MKLLFFKLLVASVFCCTTAFADAGAGGTGDPTPVPNFVFHLVESGQYADATKKLKYFVRKEKQSFDGWRLLAYSQLKSGKLKQSLKSHRKALKLNPNHEATILSLGELYLALDSLELANQQLEKLAQSCGECEQFQMLRLAIESKIAS